MTSVAIVDFYITSLTHIASPNIEWLVCRDSESNCVGVQETFEAAVAQAIQMTEYYAARGGDVQVHTQGPGANRWRTIWHRPDFSSRFPAALIGPN